MRKHRVRVWPADPADASPELQLQAAWWRWNDAGHAWSDWLPFDHAYYCVR